MNCPNDETLKRYDLEFLEDPAPVAAHLDACVECNERLARIHEEHATVEAGAKGVRVPKLASPPRSRSWIWKTVAAAAVLALFLLGITARPLKPEVTETKATDELAGRSARKSRAVPEMEKPSENRKVLDVDRWSEELVFRKDVANAECDDDEEFAKSKGSTLDYVSDRPFKGKSTRDVIGGGGRDPKDMFFEDYGTCPEFDTAKEILSTFSMDVDTASYTLARNYLKRGMLPPAAAVRVEEFVNYFRYEDAGPQNGAFAIHLEAAPSPFDKERHLLRIALVAKEIKAVDRKDVVLTFVIDVSGSMASENRLGLVKEALRHLVNKLRPSDRVGIVTYGNMAQKLLDPTPIHQRETILAVIDDLRTNGSTNAEAGLRQGYELADEFFDAKATNRVVLCSDGVANVGATGPDAILEVISRHAAKGVYLSTLGFGMGNYNDVLMEKLADKGNGNYAYIDDLAEAKKIFGEKLVGMMEVVAKDAKIQVEFDPATVSKFRRVGYENRSLKNEDFRNDKVDAGEVGAGHRVTALYEIVLKPEAKGRLAKVSIRYQEPDTKEVVEEQASIGAGQITAKPGASFRLAAAVAEFARVLRGGSKAKMKDVYEYAVPAVQDLDALEDAKELLELIKGAMKLKE